LPPIVPIYLYSIFFWWVAKNYFISARVAFQPFKVIQGRSFWHQSKVRMQLPISP